MTTTDSHGGATALPTARRPSTVRPVAITIGMVLATALALMLLYDVRRVLVWLGIAVFFTIALVPLVTWVQRHLTRGRRLFAVVLVFLTGALLIAGLVTLFAVPLATEATRFATQLPQLLNDAKTGNGLVGRLLTRTHALTYVQQNEDKIRDLATGLTTPAAGILQGLATGVIGIITVVVLTVLMVLEAPKIVDGALSLFDRDEQRDRVRHVAADCARSITGYITGNLAISVLCGILVFVILEILHVPFAGIIALFVAVADLLPIIGATLGGLVALIAAAVHSIPALIVVAIFIVAYQQLENHILQPVVFARTVKLNPLAVLIAILFGVELAGILGALLGIPVAGIIQVVLHDVWDRRRGRTKTETTTGEDRVPVTA